VLLHRWFFVKHANQIRWLCHVGELCNVQQVIDVMLHLQDSLAVHCNTFNFTYAGTKWNKGGLLSYLPHVLFGTKSASWSIWRFLLIICKKSQKENFDTCFPIHHISNKLISAVTRNCACFGYFCIVFCLIGSHHETETPKDYSAKTKLLWRKS